MDMENFIILDIETTGLSPAPIEKSGVPEDFIVCIGLADKYGITCMSRPFSEFSSAGSPRESLNLFDLEERLLHEFASSEFFDAVTSGERSIPLVTYNGRSFDIPFISTRMLRHDMNSKAAALLNARNIDLMEFVQKINGRRMSLDEACKKIGNLYVPSKSSGLWNARIYSNPRLLTPDNHVEMLQHCALDVSATWRLYHSLLRFPDFISWHDENEWKPAVEKRMKEDMDTIGGSL